MQLLLDLAQVGHARAGGKEDLAHVAAAGGDFAAPADEFLVVDAEHGAEEVGAVNLVTAIVVTYRGLDTLGEVTILFLTAAIVALLLKTKVNNPGRKVRKTGEILETASMLLFPLVMTLGVYVFINGHLTPGGGFQGGAILASGLVLLLLANPLKNVQSRVFIIL